MPNRRRKRDILRRLWKLSCDGLELSHDLFGAVPDHDFELHHYVDFLNKVSSRENLLRGLRELNPFVDDALVVAEAMTDEDFWEFKKVLKHERERQQNIRLYDPNQLELEIGTEQQEMLCEESASNIAGRFGPILVPAKFIRANMIANEAGTSFEVALGRIYEFELGS